jgi:radical SAM protein with 4Fe4S-binding SPASM domain
MVVYGVWRYGGDGYNRLQFDYAGYLSLLAMFRKKPPSLTKTRREHFGGIIFRERPAFVAYVNHAYANAYDIPAAEGAIMREGVFTAPMDAHLALTTRCNMFCRGCYTTSGGDTPKDISLEAAKAIIDRLSSLGLLSLSFGGGEPTLHPALFDIAAYAREKNVLPNMTTNGLLITKETAKKYAVFGTVHFSIHAMRDLAHVFDGVRLYQKATGVKAGLNILLTTETLPHIEDIITQARKAGVKKALLLRYKTTVKNKDTTDLDPGRQLATLFARLKKLKWADRRVMILFDCSIFEELAESNFADMQVYKKYDNNGCFGGNAFIAIDINGMCKPCSFWHEPFGSVLDLDFESWMHNPTLNAFRNMKRDEACTLCAYGEYCNGGCRLLYEGKA